MHPFGRLPKEKIQGFPPPNIVCLSGSKHRIMESIDRGAENPPTILDLIGKNTFVHKIYIQYLKFPQSRQKLKWFSLKGNCFGK